MEHYIPSIQAHKYPWPKYIKYSCHLLIVSFSDADKYLAGFISNRIPVIYTIEAEWVSNFYLYRADNACTAMRGAMSCELILFELLRQVISYTFYIMWLKAFLVSENCSSDGQLMCDAQIQQSFMTISPWVHYSYMVLMDAFYIVCLSWS